MESEEAKKGCKKWAFELDRLGNISNPSQTFFEGVCVDFTGSGN